MAKKAILVDGFKDFNSVKTAINLLRYDFESIVALIDSHQDDKQTAEKLFGVGGEIPIVKSIQEIPYANQLILGTASPGGALNKSWRQFILQAINRGWDVVSGLHTFLNNDTEFAALAKAKGVKLHDIRMNTFHEVASRKNIHESCLRIHTVGNDCNVGKMVVGLEAVKTLKELGYDAKFVPTGQTGIMITGEGLPIDSIVADFVNGAAEHLVRQNQHHNIIVVEGQGSITNPMFSSVTLGLLHGVMPDGLILCYEAGRKNFRHLDIPLTPLHQLRRIYESIASVNHPCTVIGIAINGRTLNDDALQKEKEKISSLFELPVMDVIRDRGSLVLAEAILSLKKKLGK